ncbi:hypothetical protein RhiirA1_467322 [Rhizophagus irregularis]|uniref:Uncharacterized protein n=1 Tax=Rhizophagus irregularis TaxID=588596 RepID=A0A2I1E468_9GLOM|nr:hypothetical protein RhiirA1_467322 [Rhizophagus irregularis]PKY16908.1 hypothetical protein RhiirB3_429389 [Rhizophagus irregularis]
MVEKLRSDIKKLVCKNIPIDDDLNLDNLDSLINDMARANPEPIQRITNNYLPIILSQISIKFPVFVEMLWKCYANWTSFNHIHQGFHSGNHATLSSIIIDKLQKILQHTEKRLLLNQNNLDISSLVSQCPNEILLEILLFINREYAGLKDRKGKIWDHVTALYVDLLHLLVETVNRNEEIPDDVATIKYKVKPMIISYGIVDSEIIGASYNVPIILEQGDDRVEIEDGFAVIEEEKNEPFILLGAPWLHHSWMKPIVNESVQRIASQYPHSCEHSLCVKKLEEQLEKLNNS